MQIQVTPWTGLRHCAWLLAFLASAGVSWSQCDVIYVSPTGIATNDGSEANPMDLTTALTQACVQNRKHIRLLSGTYNLNQKLVLGCDDLILDGDWEILLGRGRKNSNLTTTININSPVETAPYNGLTGTTVGYYIGVEAIDEDDFLLQDITFNVKNGGAAGLPSGTTGNRGRSVYGFYFRNATGWHIERCEMRTGSGTTGANGIAGANGLGGIAGGTGSRAHCNDDCTTNQGGRGGRGGGGPNGAPTNVDGSCRNQGQNGSNGTAASGRNGGSGASGGSAGAENNRGGSGGSGGGSAAGSGGSGGSFGNGHGSSGSGNCGSVNASNGSPGLNGSDGTAGAALPISNTFAHFWLPSGQSSRGTDATGGSGGGGGGGGGGQGCLFCTDGTGGGGGGGGGGGQGGAGGQGGWGSGGAFGIFAVASTGTYNNVTLAPGAARLGGNGGNGGNPGNGGPGGGLGGQSGGLLGCSTCEVGRGGLGGPGGNGGHGGNGGRGASGRSEAVRTISGGAANSSTTPNITNIITNESLEGCQHSEIVITKNGGTWGLPANAGYIQDLSQGNSSYNNSSTTAIISYNTVGSQDILINGVRYPNFIQINTTRPLPTFGSSMQNVVCEGLTFTMNTPTAADQYEWVLFEGSNNTTNPAGIYNTQVANFPTPTTGSTVNYHLRLRLRDDCCGWSEPVYFDFDVVPNANGPTVMTDTVCAGESATVTAMGTGTLAWHSDALGQIRLASGPAPSLTYTTPILNQNTVFYAGQSIASCTAPLTAAEVVVNALPNQPSVTPISVCSGDTVVLTATGSGAGDLIFYDNTNTEIGRITQSPTNPTATLIVGALGVGSYSYYAAESDGDCTSPNALIGVTVTPLPAAPVSNGVTICEGNATTLTAVGTGTINWYSDPTLNNVVGVGNSYNTPVLSTNTTYYTTQTNANGCESASSAVTVTVNLNPITPVATGATICSGATATLSATAAGTIQWYADPSGASLLATGASFITPSLTQTTTYYVRQINTTTGCASPLVGIIATVNALPAAPSVVSPIVVCSGNSVSLTATGSGTGDLVFYDNTNTEIGRITMSGTPSGSFSLGVLAAGNYTYSVREDNGNCVSGAVPVSVIVNALPAAPSTTGTTICAGNRAMLMASGTGNLQWYSDTALTTLIATGNVYNTAILTTTTTYYVTQTNTNGCTSSATMVVATVDPPPTAPAVTNATVCTGETAALTATATGTIQWYADPSGASLLATGSSFTTVPLTQTTTYYVRQVNGSTGCNSALAPVTVTVNALPAAPSAASPTIVCDGNTVSLSATGSGTGDLVFYDNTNTEIGRITMSGTPSGSFSLGILTAGNYTYSVREDNGNCVSGAVPISVSVNALPTAPISAGTTICEGNSTTLSSLSTGTITWYADAALTTVLSVGNIYQSGPLFTSTDFYLTQTDANGCVSPNTMVTITVNAAPVAPSVANTTICAGETATFTTTAVGTVQWFSDANGLNLLNTGPSFTTVGLTQNTTFYVRQISASGCASALSPVVATVNALPAAPSATTGLAVCEGDVATLTATGSGTGDLVFYDNTNTEIGRITMSGTPTNSISLGVLPVGTYTYSVREDNGSCLSAAVPVALVVNATPTAPSLTGTTLCAGESATLMAPTTVHWYADTALTQLLTTSTSLTTSALTTTTTYYAIATNANGCNSASAQVVVTVNALPALPVLNGDSVCIGENAALTANAGTNTVNWYDNALGMTSIATGTNFPLNAVQQSRLYYARSIGPATGCESDLATTTVTVTPLPNAPFASPVAECENIALNLTATGSGTGTLIFYDNNQTILGSQSMATGAMQTFGVGTPAVGNYLYYVAEERNGCTSAPAPLNARVKPVPAAPSTFNDSPVCEGETVFVQAAAISGGSYFWTGPNSFTASTPNFSIPNSTPAEAGNYDVVVTVDGCASPAATTTVTVNTRPVLGAVSSNSPLCEGDNLNLTSTSTGLTYVWVGPNGFSANTANTNINAVNEGDNQGFYTLVGTDTKGCASAPVSTLVMITELPNAGMASSNTPICEGTDLKLNIPTVFGATYTWSGPNGYQSTDQNPIIGNATAANAGTYTVTVTVGNCFSEYQTDVAVNAGTVVDAGMDTTITLGTPLRLIASGATLYNWSPADNLDDPNSAVPVFMAPSVGTYTLSVQGSTPGGCSGADKVTITVELPAIADLKVVDLFTPNGDGVNDAWTVDFLQDATIGNYTLQVFTRGGIEVLNTQNYQNDWYGTLDGRNLPEGAYWYVIYLEDTDEVIKGAVTIKR